MPKHEAEHLGCAWFEKNEGKEKKTGRKINFCFVRETKKERKGEENE